MPCPPPQLNMLNEQKRGQEIARANERRRRREARRARAAAAELDGGDADYEQYRVRLVCAFLLLCVECGAALQQRKGWAWAPTVRVMRGGFVAVICFCGGSLFDCGRCRRATILAVLTW